MNWIGKWRNQYGSELEITNDADQKLTGTFTTALADSGFAGQTIPMVGFHQGECLGVSGGGRSPAGDMLVTYTGLFREGKLETLWYVVADATLSAEAAGQPASVKKLGWWRSMSTGADTFVRVPR